MPGAKTPAIVLGGSQNALSVARNLARHNIEVIALNYPYEAVRFSRHARYLRVDGGSSPVKWEQFLLGRESDHLCGSVLLPCSDEAISIIIRNHETLSRKFLLEETDPMMRSELLDKFSTYERAREAGIPTVRYWRVTTSEDLERSMPEYSFPLVLKALYPPNADLLKSKAMLISDQEALIQHARIALTLGIGVVLMEYVAGGDDRACSYHTYLDENNNPLFQYTNTVKRRYPLMSGEATYCVTSWIPDAAELGLRFFRHLRFRGLGMIQFKRDERDEQLKIIEVNARFVASNSLVTRSGIDLALLSYNRITARPQKRIAGFDESLVLCRPLLDVAAAWQLRKKAELRLLDWIAEVHRIDQFPFFDWNDPVPAVFVLFWRTWRVGTRLLRDGLARVAELVRNVGIGSRPANDSTTRASARIV